LVQTEKYGIYYYYHILKSVFHIDVIACIGEAFTDAAPRNREKQRVHRLGGKHQ